MTDKTNTPNKKHQRVSGKKTYQMPLLSYYYLLFYKTILMNENNIVVFS